jgi:membrane protein implicated in regulation of membrane protease activity
MDNMSLWWTIIGIVLIIVEMLSGTFYLLVLGIAALGAAAAAWAGYSFWVQAVVTAAVATAGVILVRRQRGKVAPASAQSLDIGQPVTVESWVSEADGIARVSYRNAQWEARVVGERNPDARVFYIQSVDGNTLTVSSHRP